MKIVSASLLVFSAITVGIVYGHDGATGIVKERMDAMQDMGDKSKIVANMFKGKIEFDQNALVDAADAFAQHGVQMAQLFPNTEESRTGSKTDALPKIWDDWDDFSEHVAEFVELSESLKDTVLQTDDAGQLKKAFSKTAKSCFGCHKRFRKPKE